jgi:hypothetical protein
MLHSIIEMLQPVEVSKNVLKVDRARKCLQEGQFPA